MQITKQADYALRAMLYLARLEPNQRAATNQMCIRDRGKYDRARTLLNKVESISGFRCV